MSLHFRDPFESGDFRPTFNIAFILLNRTGERLPKRERFHRVFAHTMGEALEYVRNLPAEQVYITTPSPELKSYTYNTTTEQLEEEEPDRNWLLERRTKRKK